MDKKLLIAISVTALVTGVIVYLINPKAATAPQDGVTDTQTQTEVATSTATTTEEGATNTSTPASGTGATPRTYTPPKAQVSLPYTATILYTGTRFVPEEVTIIEGGTVRFINQSDEKMWIASDNHPTHTRYPVHTESDCAGSIFDQCTSVAKGGSWSFRFNERGTWGFHNHERAQDTGKVIVRTVEEYLKENQ